MVPKSGNICIHIYIYTLYYIYIYIIVYIYIHHYMYIHTPVQSRGLPLRILDKIRAHASDPKDTATGPMLWTLRHGQSLQHLLVSVEPILRNALEPGGMPSFQGLICRAKQLPNLFRYI